MNILNIICPRVFGVRQNEVKVSKTSPIPLWRSNEKNPHEIRQVRRENEFFPSLIQVFVLITDYPLAGQLTHNHKILLIFFFEWFF